MHGVNEARGVQGVNEARGVQGVNEARGGDGVGGVGDSSMSTSIAWNLSSLVSLMSNISSLEDITSKAQTFPTKINNLARIVLLGLLEIITGIISW